jgi:hypothetical protein
MEKVICKGRTTGGLLVEIIKDQDQAKREHFRGVRCGLSWPTGIRPAYYCLVGQLSKNLITGKYPLRFLKEGEAETPSRLFQQMLDEMGEFYCWEIYTDLSEKHRSYIIAFDQYQRGNRSQQKTKIVYAPFYQNFVHGITLLKEWTRAEALYIPPDTIVHAQLRTITTENLQEDPESSFHAINALRYVVGSFEVSNYSPPRRIKRTDTPPMGAWT